MQVQGHGTDLENSDESTADAWLKPYGEPTSPRNLTRNSDQAIPMGLRTWLKQRLGNTPVESIDLVGPTVAQVPAPERLGISLAMPAQPWSVSRLEGLFREAEHQPTALSLKAARLARHRLSVFWLSAPVDQLAELYASGIGDLQRQQLNSGLGQQTLASDEKIWRDQLAAEMVKPEALSRQLNVILALIPYTKPGKLKLTDPIRSLPNWLLADYVAYCAPELKHELEGPAGLLEPASEKTQPAVKQAPVHTEDFSPLTERRGEEALALFRDEDVLTRIKSLVNLYGMAPDDAETLSELSGLRKMVAQLWLDVESSQLESLYQLPVGLITRSLITSGFGKELVDDDDARARQDLPSLSADIQNPECHGPLLATLLYYAPNAITFESTAGLPEWLLQELNSL